MNYLPTFASREGEISYQLLKLTGRMLLDFLSRTLSKPVELEVFHRYIFNPKDRYKTARVSRSKRKEGLLRIYYLSMGLAPLLLHPQSMLL